MDSAERRREASDIDGDRISSLPDDLLHAILLRLRSTPAAARTSLLSRRWRHLWTQLAEIVLDNLHEPAAVTAALARVADANTAPTEFSRFAITFRHLQLPIARIAPWLDFAAQRLTGELSLSLAAGKHQKEELKLPVMEKVTAINISSGHILRLPPAGSFAALLAVDISHARLDGRDVACFGSSRCCPRLRALHLRGAVRLVAASDVAIRSESLETLFYRVENTRRLEVVAPRLRVLRAQGRSGDPAKLDEARIVAPRLADVAWYGEYDPARHQFVQVGRHLQALLMVELSMTALMRRFDTVDELVLRLGLPQGKEWYERFLTATSKLAKCEAMEVYLATGRHAFAPSVLHVLRHANGIRKLLVRLPMTTLHENIGSKRDPCELGCPCCLPENYRTDNVAIDSLEEVIIVNFRGLYHHEEFLNLLLECSTAKLRNLSIYMSADASVSMESCQKIKSAARPDTNIQFNVLPQGSFLSLVNL